MRIIKHDRNNTPNNFVVWEVVEVDCFRMGTIIDIKNKGKTLVVRIDHGDHPCMRNSKVPFVGENYLLLPYSSCDKMDQFMNFNEKVYKKNPNGEVVALSWRVTKDYHHGWEFVGKSMRWNKIHKLKEVSINEDKTFKELGSF